MRQTSRAQVDYRRLARRNLPSLLRYKFLHEYGYDKGKVVVAAIVEDICNLVRCYYRREGDLEPGQLIYLAAGIGQGAGRAKTIGQTKLVPVKLTIVADEDLEAVRQGLPQSERRTIRVRRLTRQAYQQGGLLSQRDIAIVTGYSPGGVSLSAVSLRERGEFVPLRGYVMDMGCFPTHKAAIIRLYLQGMLTPDIARRTYHSKEAVDRYIRGFERVRLLASKFSTEELPLLTGMNERVIEQYLVLIDQYRPTEARNDAVASS
ncbi:MAG: DUF1670 domain-containing protein [Actinomycetota bacterium]